jgi:thiamine-monophosphate kinase
VRGEFDLIDTFVRALPRAPAPRGPGDDAAVLPGRLCVTTDALVEGVHFTRPFFSLEDIGHKALATNLSDLAAMGAKPTWWLCALALPKGFTQVRALAKGMRPLAKRYGLTLAGGNVTSSLVLSLTLTVAGLARKPMLRSGARPGDALYVGGWLGDAAANFLAQRRPVPLVEEGLIAARYASACIDVSDGLLQDLNHLCKASRVGADLSSSELPVSENVRRHPRGRDLALSGGEDYALVLAVPHPKRAAFERAWPRRVPLRRIGRFTSRRALRLDGKRVAPQGFDHFKR